MSASSFRKIALLSVPAFALSALLFLSGLLDTFELKAYDYMSRHLNPRSASDHIVIVAIDQKSISALAGQDISWPWPRQVYAPMLEHLAEADAVFMDILFTEDSSYGVADDNVFTEAMQNSGKVYLPLLLTNTRASLSGHDAELAQKISMPGPTATGIPSRSLISPLRQFSSASAGLGNVMIKPDEDGIYRRTPLFFPAAEYTIPHFVLPYLLGKKLVTVHDNRVYSSGRKIPLSGGTMLLRYSPDTSPFRTVSASDIIQSHLDSIAGKEPLMKKESFRGKIIFVGLTAPGLYDLKPTAVTPISTGVHIHATTLDNIIRQNYLIQIDVLPVIFFMLVVSVMVTASVLRYHSLFASAVVFSAAVLTALAAPALMFLYGLYLKVIPALIAAVLSFAVAAAYSYAVEGRQRRFIKRTFDQYMDRTLVEHVLENPELIRPGGRKMRVTVFFADIAGFTTLAEQLSPEKAAMVLHDIFNAFTEVIIRNRGVIDKYIGDCVMAFWGAPVSSGQDESSACCAAIACMQALLDLNVSFAAQGLPCVSMRIGIHTGDALVGNLGSDRLFDYTVVGDTVNLASRLESVNKVFGTRIIVSRETFVATADIFLARELGRIEVKGKAAATAVYELIGFRDNATEKTRDMVSLFHDGLERFRREEWQQAEEIFSRVLGNNPEDGPSAFYLRRCASPLSTTSLTGCSDIITMTEK